MGIRDRAKGKYKIGIAQINPENQQVMGKVPLFKDTTAMDKLLEEQNDYGEPLYEAQVLNELAIYGEDQGYNELDDTTKAFFRPQVTVYGENFTTQFNQPIYISSQPAEGARKEVWYAPRIDDAGVRIDWRSNTDYNDPPAAVDAVWRLAEGFTTYGFGLVKDGSQGATLTLRDGDYDDTGFETAGGSFYSLGRYPISSQIVSTGLLKDYKVNLSIPCEAGAQDENAEGVNDYIPKIGRLEYRYKAPGSNNFTSDVAYDCSGTSAAVQGGQLNYPKIQKLASAPNSFKLTLTEPDPAYTPVDQIYGYEIRVSYNKGTGLRPGAETSHTLLVKKEDLAADGTVDFEDLVDLLVADLKEVDSPILVFRVQARSIAHNSVLNSSSAWTTSSKAMEYSVVVENLPAPQLKLTVEGSDSAMSAPTDVYKRQRWS